MMTPLEIEVAIHHIVTCEPYWRPSRAYDDAAKKLLRLGIIMIDHNEENQGVFKGTPKGRAWLKMICATPMPEVAWLDPRTQEKV